MSTAITRKPLYEIADELNRAGEALNAYFDLPDDERDQEAETALMLAWKGLTLKLEDKVEGCAHIITEGAAWADMIRREIGRLQAMLASVEAKTEWIKRYVRDCMMLAQVRRVDGVTIKVWRQTSPKAVLISPEAPLDARDYLPAHLVRETHKYEPDRAAILKHHEETGELFDYVTIVEREHLRVK